MNHRQKLVVCFVILGALVLPGAPCQPVRPKQPEAALITPTTSNATSPGSAGVTPVDPKWGVKWNANSFPPGGNGNIYPLIKKHREEIGLPPVTWHAGLSGVATKHSSDMNDRDYFSTKTPEGIDIFQRLVSSQKRIDFSSAAAFVISNPGNVSGQLLFDTLYNNFPTFKAAVDNPLFTHFAADHVLKGKGYGTMIFGEKVTP